MNKGSVFFNGRIYTVDAAFSRVSILACRDGEIVYLGEDLDKAKTLAGSGHEIANLRGHTVLPGFVESHMHFVEEGQRLSQMDIFLRPKYDILRLVKEEATRHRPGEWIIGHGWDNELWPDTSWPRKAELDAVAPDNPVALTRADSHSMWVNSLALTAAGFTRESADMPGGEILRDESGELLGILVEAPVHKVWEAQPALDEAQIRSACLKTQKELFYCGVTSAANAWHPLKEHYFIEKMFAEGILKIRLNGILPAFELEHAKAPMPVRGLYGERLSLAACKLVLDGSLGSRSAWLGEDYADRPGHRGNSRYNTGELRALVRKARELGFQVCAHAIGDAAVTQALDAFEQVLGDAPLQDHRYRLEHFQIVQPNDLKRALRLGVLPSMQTIHWAADREMAAKRLRPQSLEISYPWQRIIENGGIFANGSDSPVATVNPFCGMYAAVTRPASSINHANALRQNALSRADALRSYTAWGAAAEFSERRKGTLEAGKLADFIVLDRDALICPAEELKETRVLMTVLGGERVYVHEACTFG